MRRSLMSILVLLGCAEEPAPPVQAPPASAPSAAAPAGQPPPSAEAPKAPAPPAAEPPNEPWRKEQPAGAPAPEVKLPKAQVARLKNGLEVILVETHHLPVVSAELVVFAGAERSGAREPGLAGLVAALLTEGTKKHDALALADAIDQIGAELGAGASHDAVGISLTTLTKHLDAALDLYAEVVLEPTFPAEELERVRDRRLTALLQQKDNPNAVAQNVGARVVYGDDHPYGFPLLGTEKALKSYARADVEKYWQTYFRPGNAKLIVVGDTTLADIKQKLDARLGDWKPGPVGRARPPGAPKPAGGRRVFVVDKPKASQSIVMLAHVGVARSSPDYIPLVVANYILGGAFSSRINMNLREKKGYSYGARSTFSFLRGPGPFSAGGNMRGDATKDSLSELLKELGSFRDAKVEADELAEAKSSLIGKMAGRFETNAQVASQLAELIENNLPLDWYASYAKKVGAVTAADVQRVARKYLHPERAQIVVVGDWKSVESGLKELKLGAIELRDPFGDKP